MKFTNTFLVIALLSISLTNSFEFASLSELSEINSSSYGKSLLETISLTLEQKGNVNEIQRLLNDLLFKLNQDQEKDTNKWNRENDRLKTKIKKLTKTIKNLNAEIARLEAELKKYEKLRDKAASNLEQYKKQRGNNDHSLSQNMARREGDAAEFKKSQSEHTDVKNAIDAVIAELKKLLGSVSGTGRPVHVKQTAEELRDSLKKSFVQLSQDEQDVQNFIELATEADQNGVRTLIAKLSKIRRSTEASYNDDEDHERRSKQLYKELKGLLESDNRKLDGMIRHEAKNHKAYIKRVGELKTKITNNKKLRKSKKEELEATKKEREAKEKRYNDDKAQRDEERRVILRIQEIVKKRLSNMSKYLDSQI